MVRECSPRLRGTEMARSFSHRNVGVAARANVPATISMVTRDILGGVESVPLAPTIHRPNTPRVPSGPRDIPPPSHRPILRPCCPDLLISGRKAAIRFSPVAKVKFESTTRVMATNIPRPSERQ